MLVKYGEIWKKRWRRGGERDLGEKGEGEWRSNKSVKVIILKVLQLAPDKVVHGVGFQRFL